MNIEYRCVYRLLLRKPNYNSINCVDYKVTFRKNILRMCKITTEEMAPQSYRTNLRVIPKYISSGNIYCHCIFINTVVYERGHLGISVLTLFCWFTISKD